MKVGEEYRLKDESCANKCGNVARAIKECKVRWRDIIIWITHIDDYGMIRYDIDVMENGSRTTVDWCDCCLNESHLKLAEKKIAEDKKN